MARCIGARAEARTYSACSAIRQVKPGLVDRGSRRVLEELAMGIGVFHVEHYAGHCPPSDPTAGSILISPRPRSASSRIERVARLETAQGARGLILCTTR